mgnify:CR=1 FL=1
MSKRPDRRLVGGRNGELPADLDGIDGRVGVERDDRHLFDIGGDELVLVAGDRRQSEQYEIDPYFVHG